jgi:hypothetical protein
MMRALGVSAVLALALAAPSLLAQATVSPKAKEHPVSTRPWPDEEELLARKTEAQNRKLFQDGPPPEFTLTADFNSINKERTPNNAKQFPAVLTIGGANIPVRLASRGHLRLKTDVCDFVPLKVTFTSTTQLTDTIFDGQTTLKLGTHCRTERDFDQYVVREYLSYKLGNLVTPLLFRARLAHATYVNAGSKKSSTHMALFLEHENDVARRLSGREVRVPHLAFRDFDREALTRAMLLEYMLGNTDYSIWSLHNVVIVQDKQRHLLPVPYDFDLSGMVHTPYAAPDPRLFLKEVTDRLYRGPCRSVDEFNAAAEPFRAREAEMMTVIDSSHELNGVHKGEMKSYLEGFFRRIATPESIKKTFVDGCPASRSRV